MTTQIEPFIREFAESTLGTASTGYDNFAWFYDQYWGRDIARDFLSALQTLLLPKLKPGATVLDLCCGTGRLAAELLRVGLDITGIDSSSEMLHYARERAVGAEFVHADARTFDLGRNYNAVVSTFDSLNHMMSLMDLTSVFQRVHAVLISGGLFLFDMNLEQGFRLHWQEEFSFVADDAVCVVKGLYDKSAKLGTYEFTLFRRIMDLWARSDFTISQRPYRRNQIERALRNTGFVNIAVFDAQKELGLTDHAGRIFLLAERK